MIVADASIVVDMLLGKGSEAGDELASRFSAHEVVCAPHLLDAEVGQVLRRFVLRRDLTRATADTLVEDFLALPIRRYPHSLILESALKYLENVTVYDGLYLALAEVLDCQLLTGDSALSQVPGCRADVTVLTTTA